MEVSLNVRVLALDLEHTLIDESLSARPRPGLLEFLTFCDERFGRVAIFTTMEESDAREVLEGLGRAGHLPPGLLSRLEYVAWSGEYKDLGFVPDAAIEEILLVDDDVGWVRPHQRERWIRIEAWNGGSDIELRRMRAVLENWLSERSENPSGVKPTV
jgi:hypothetical protein